MLLGHRSRSDGNVSPRGCRSGIISLHGGARHRSLRRVTYISVRARPTRGGWSRAFVTSSVTYDVTPGDDRLPEVIQSERCRPRARCTAGVVTGAFLRAGLLMDFGLSAADAAPCGIAKSSRCFVRDNELRRRDCQPE